MSSAPAYSFVIPVYKSVASLEPLFEGIKQLMTEYGAGFEVIFVEDNGSKESWNKLLEIKAKHAGEVSLIMLSRNFGQNGATLCGITEARGKFVVTIDDDLQVHPAEIKKLIECEQKTNADVIYGVYSEKSGTWLRNTGSRLIKLLFRKTEGGSNIGSSIRLLSRNITEHLRNHSQDHLFINQVISWYTFNTSFVEVERNPRSEGDSGYSLTQLFLIAFRLFFIYTTAPLKIMIALCIMGSVAAVTLAGYYIYRHFVFGQGLGFLIIIVIAVSLILAGISIMGIYINRLYSARVKKPHFAIKVKL